MIILAYIIRQDTLFVQSYALFDHNLVADHRLSDLHLAGYVNIIPDVGMVQGNIVTCWYGEQKRHY